MMCDTNWCTFCDSAISPYSDSLYCSEDCLKQDALMRHPMLGYDYADLKGFPHHNSQQYQQQQQHNREETMMPSLVRRKSSIPSMLNNLSTSSNNEYFSQLQKIPSLSPSLSSSISSYSSNNDTIKDTTTYFQPKPRKVSANTVPFMEQLNQALLRT
ncbi:hypothetical protein BDF21DRAFT_409133 [Thamnidium elegans]|nr:hypothetical protein BDF21DRAFT_409133 [Thamnidium elegans]